MKISKLIIFISLLSNGLAFCQQGRSVKKIAKADLGKPGSGGNIYVYDESLNKFAGTWFGVKGNDSLRIHLIKKVFQVNKIPGQIFDLDFITGTFEYFMNNKRIAYYAGNDLVESTGGQKDTLDMFTPGNDLMASMGSKKDTLNIFINVKLRKAQAALLAIYLADGKLKVEIEKNRFEFKNDKNFELQEPMILTKQR